MYGENLFLVPSCSTVYFPTMPGPGSPVKILPCRRPSKFLIFNSCDFKYLSSVAVLFTYYVSRERGVRKMLTIADEGGRGLSQKLTKIFNKRSLRVSTGKHSKRFTGLFGNSSQQGGRVRHLGKIAK